MYVSPKIYLETSLRRPDRDVICRALGLMGTITGIFCRTNYHSPYTVSLESDLEFQLVACAVYKVTDIFIAY